jgi:hypothetical protein
MCLNILTFFLKPIYYPVKSNLGEGSQNVYRPPDKEEFLEMLGKLQNYSTAINAKAEPFPSEPVLMALLFEQHKLIL